MRDLQTSSDRLSLWLLSDTLDEIPRLAAAQAVMRQHCQSLDYVRAPAEAVQGLGITVETTDGGFDDVGINGLHRDGVQLTARQLAEVANLFVDSARRVPERDVAMAISASVADGHLPVAALSDDIIRKLRDYGLLTDADGATV